MILICEYNSFHLKCKFYVKTEFDRIFIDFKFPEGFSNPWIEINFGWTRFIDGVNISLGKEAFDDLMNDTLEVRFGFEINR